MLTAPWREAVFLFRMALSSAWHTYGYLVSRGSPLRESFAQGQLAVWAAPWEAVVAYPQDDLVLAHYACANLQQAGGHISGVHLCRSILLSLLIAADYSGLQLICSSAHVHFDIPAQHAASRHSDTALHASMYSPAP